MAGVAMRALVLTLLTFKKVKLIFGHPVSFFFVYVKQSSIIIIVVIINSVQDVMTSERWTKNGISLSNPADTSTSTRTRQVSPLTEIKPTMETPLLASMTEPTKANSTSVSPTMETTPLVPTMEPSSPISARDCDHIWNQGNNENYMVSMKFSLTQHVHHNHHFKLYVTLKPFAVDG